MWCFHWAVLPTLYFRIKSVLLNCAGFPYRGLILPTSPTVISSPSSLKKGWCDVPDYIIQTRNLDPPVIMNRVLLESKLSAHHSSVVNVPEIITNQAPFVTGISLDLHSTFVFTPSCNEPVHVTRWIMNGWLTHNFVIALLAFKIGLYRISLIQSIITL